MITPKFKWLVLVVIPFTLTGCLGEMIELSCLFTADSDHCYQSAAVQQSEADTCAKIKGEGFKSSNPPRDKCYLQIAENTGDVSVCDKIQGGPLSYSRLECVISAAQNFDDPAKCRVLSSEDFKQCKQAFSTSITREKLNEITDEVENLKSEAGADPDDEELQAKLKAAKEKEAAFFEMASSDTKAAYMKAAREEIMSELEDDDVKSQVAKIFTAFRNQNPETSLNEQIKKMQEIKDQQDQIKNLDEIANTLMDQIKESAGDFAGDTIEDLYGDDIEKYKAEMQKRGMAYLEEKGGDSLKSGISQLETLKGKYDKASEQYEAISAQIERLKKVYDEASEVYKKVDEINKLVADGKIDAGKAQALHGAVFLGKGLEYATEYVPVFGSTISTISKETFDATLEFAKKRAQRTTALDKCIEDPEHCDPNDISAY